MNHKYDYKMNWTTQSSVTNNIINHITITKLSDILGFVLKIYQQPFKCLNGMVCTVQLLRQAPCILSHYTVLLHSTPFIVVTAEALSQSPHQPESVIAGVYFSQTSIIFFCLRCTTAVRIIGVAVHYSRVFVRQDVVLKSGQLIANFGIVMVIR